MANTLTKLDDYYYWRDKKLANSETKLENCSIEINNPFALSDTECTKLKQLCQHNNFVVFDIPNQNSYPQAIIAMNQQLGLINYDQHLYAQTDGLAHITQSNKQRQAGFIPYTNKAIGWHTDGYYNAISNRIRAFSLFCVNPALSGGKNQWIDPQMVYILLRENNADVTKALTHPQAMTIPAHMVNGVIRRETSLGPIFFIDEHTNELYMRYTQRKHNIEFHNSTEIKQAVALLDNLLAQGSAYHFQHLMAKNQGIICNNVIHKRSGFIDDKHNPRLLLRGRYFERI